MLETVFFLFGISFCLIMSAIFAEIKSSNELKRKRASLLDKHDRKLSELGEYTRRVEQDMIKLAKDLRVVKDDNDYYKNTIANLLHDINVSNQKVKGD